MEPFGHGAIGFGHLGDLREHVAFPVRLAGARAAARGRLQLSGALAHRGSFLGREPRGRLAGGALGGPLRARLRAVGSSVRDMSARVHRIRSYEA
jgi:hypothetical protein